MNVDLIKIGEKWKKEINLMELLKMAKVKKKILSWKIILSYNLRNA